MIELVISTVRMGRTKATFLILREDAVNHSVSVTSDSTRTYAQKRANEILSWEMVRRCQ